MEEGADEVDETLQEEFFRNVASQLQSIDQFFKKEASLLQFSLSELEDQVSFCIIHGLCCLVVIPSTSHVYDIVLMCDHECGCRCLCWLL